MFNISDLFSSVPVVFLIAGVAILLGHLMNVLMGIIMKRKGNIDLFWKFLSGLLLLISLYGIVMTKGLSILLPVPVLLLLFFKYKYQNIPENDPDVKKDMAFLLLSLIVNVVFFFIAFHSFESENVKFVYGDFNIYYRIAANVNSYGVESSSLESLAAPSNINPYHFGDIWFYAMIAKLTSGTPSKVFFIAFSVLTSLFVTGIYTHLKQSFQRYHKGGFVFLYLIVLAGLFNGFAIFFPKFLFTADIYLLSVANWGKIIIQSCFIIGLIKLARPAEWRPFVLLAILAGFSFINIMPAIFTATFLLLTINVLLKRLSWKEWFKLNTFYIGFSAIFLIVLYKIAGPYLGVHDVEAHNDTSMLSRFASFKYFRTVLAIFVGGWFQLFTIIPYLLVLLSGMIITKKTKQLYKVKLFENDVILLILLFGSGLLCWAVLHPVAVDTVQFFHNIIASLYAIGISLIFAYTVYVVKNKVLTGITILIILSSIWISRENIFYVGKFKKSEIQKLTTYFDQEKETVVLANLQPQSYFNTFFNKNTNYYIPLPILNYEWPSYTNLSLNAPFIPVDEHNVYVAEERKIIASAPFSKYYKQQHTTGSRQETEELAQSFLIKNKIKYLSVSRDTSLPQIFRSAVQDSLVLTDPACIIYKIKL